MPQIQSHKFFRWLALGALTLLSLQFQGCAQAYYDSIGTLPETYHRIYVADFESAWQAVQEALKSVKLDISNREGGFIQTKWTDNTLEKTFSERGSFMKAKYRFLISIAKTFYNGRPCVKVTVQKEQVIQHDILEGWRPQESDSIEEKTLLYRIGRLIYTRARLAKLAAERSRRELEKN